MSRPSMFLFATVAWTGCLALAVILTLLISPGNIPSDKTSPDYGRSDQCEHLRTDKTVMEAQNTWSNLGYLYVGLLVLFRNLTPKRLFNMLFGASMVALAWFSGLYHAYPLSDTYRHLDVIGIYWVLPILIAYAIHGLVVYRFPDIRIQNVHVIGFVLIILFLGAVLPFIGADSTVVVIVLLGILVVLVVLLLFVKSLFYPFSDIEKASYSTILVSLLVACAVFKLFEGPSKAYCFEYASVQPHALWHLFGAVTLLVGYNVLSRGFSDGGTVFPMLEGGR